MIGIRFTAAIAALLAGCTVGPDYVRAPFEAPAAWRIDAAQAAEVANTAWWAQFGDPVLERLVEQALANNRDLLAAAARIDQFAGALATTRSQFYPQIGYGVEAGRSRTSEALLPPGADPYATVIQAALSAQWQIDLFGRVRRQSEAAQAQVYASEQGRRGLVLSLVSGVAAGYLALCGLDRQLEIARATADNRAGTQRIFDLRFKGGVVSGFEVAQVDPQYQQALAATPGIEQQIAAQENLLSVLLGAAPGPIPRGRTIEQGVRPAVPAALLSSLLERRPDILQAEQGLVAANAGIGVARSLYYPQLSLTGPIFTFAAIEGQVASAEARQREALANYRQIVLNAFRETNDALTGAAKKRGEAEAQRRRVRSLREFARLSTLRWENGYSSYTDVLYAQNELFGAELAAVNSQVGALAQLVAVYGAVGGGWVDLAAQRAPQPLAAVSAASAPAR